MSNEEWDIIERVLDNALIAVAGFGAGYWLLSIFTEFLERSIH